MRDFSDYISNLPTNHMEALHEICTDFFKMHAENQTENGNAWESYSRHRYQMFFKIACKFVSNFGLKFEVPEEAKTNGAVINFFVNFDVDVSAWLAEQVFDAKFAPTSE